MSETVLSADTQVVLLLCGRFGGERQEPFTPLTPKDYGELAKWLNARSLRPADLLNSDGQAALSELHEAKLDRQRLEFLLGRGTAMALALERWQRAGLWVISRGDAAFPKQLKRQLKHAAPPILYGAGSQDLLDMGGLAIIGSRDASDSALDFTRRIAAQCARENMAVISGGARGVDSAAMQGATDAGGYSIGILANDLLKACVNRQNRMGLQEGRLVLVSPFYPEASFNAGNAMGRNKYIYALANQALVIDSALESGGTWDGAVEALKKQWCPVYVRSPGEGAGNAALIEKGGIPFSYQPGQGEALSDIFANHASQGLSEVSPSEPPQPSLLDLVADAAEVAESGPTESNDVPHDVGVTVVHAAEPMPASVAPAPVEAAAKDALTLDLFQEFVLRLKIVLAGSELNDEQVAQALGLEKGQAKVWLKRAEEEAIVAKLKKPVRYALALQSSLLK